MSATAPFKATFSDFKLVKTRSTAQIILEVPIEEANAALDYLGGVPIPAQEIFVAVARFEEKPVSVPLVYNKRQPIIPSKKARRKFEDLPLPTQAGIIANEPNFWKWAGVMDEVDAKKFIRHNCGVDSLAEFSTDQIAAHQWRMLLGQYEKWKNLNPLKASPIGELIYQSLIESGQGGSNV